MGALTVSSLEARADPDARPVRAHLSCPQDLGALASVLGAQDLSPRAETLLVGDGPTLIGAIHGERPARVAREAADMETRLRHRIRALRGT